MVGSHVWYDLGPVPISYKIFEFIETKNCVQMKTLGDFGSPMPKLMWFPQSIKQRKNGKFILFPKFSTKFYRFVEDFRLDFEEVFEEEFSIEVEEWEKNLYANRSSFYFPFSLKHEMKALWIFHV